MMSNQGTSSSETSHSVGTLPGCPMTPSKSVSPPDSSAGGAQDTTDADSVPCLSPAPSSMSLQQNTSSSCLKTNQGFQAVSCLTAELPQPQVVKNLGLQTDQPSQQQGPLQQQQPAQDPSAMQHVVQQGQQLQQSQQLQPNNHLQQSQQLTQNQPLQQNQQQLQQNQQQLQQQSQQQLQQQSQQQLQQQSQQQLQQQSQQQLQQQSQQQLQQSQQQLQLSQQLHQGSHMQSAGLQLSQVQQLQPGQQSQQLQLQHPLQLQQGQQLLQQQQTQHIQQLLQQQQQNQHQQGQQLLQSQQQVQQMLQQQQSQQQQSQQHHNQQLLQHVDQQPQSQQQQQLLQPIQGQEFFQQHQVQPVLQQQQNSQQQLHQQQMQHGQRFLQQPGQHLLPQQAQQQLLSQQQGQQQLLQPLQQQQQLNQQQLLQQVGQQQLLNSLQSSGQQLYQAMQPGQPGLFQPQSGQQLLQTSLLQSPPNQALMQQQPFQVNHQQLLQQPTQQQMIQQQQQLTNLQQQIVLQAIQAQGTGSGVNLSNMTGRSLSIMPSGSSFGLVNTVPANVYRQLVSSVSQGTSTTTLATQISKSSPAAGSRATLGQPSPQRPTPMQVLQPRQNTPLFIGQFGMVSNGTIIPSGIVPLARPQVSGSVTVQTTGAQSQILGSPTQVQLATSLLGSAGAMLNHQTLQAAMAQLQQQQGTSLLTSQPLYIQPGISISSQTDGTGTSVTMAKSTAPLTLSQLSGGLNVSLPVQIAIGATGLAQGLQARPISWPAVTTTSADKDIFGLLLSDANQLKVAAMPTSIHDLTLMEAVALGNRGLYSSVTENCVVPLGSESQFNVASSQGFSNTNCRLSTSNQHDGIPTEKSQGLSGSLSDTGGCHALAKVSGSTDGPNAGGEKQTATVKPQILTHVIEGFVIQEGSEPFPVQPSSFMSEFLDSTDDMTDSSCDGQSDEETPEDKTKTTTGKSQDMNDYPDIEHPSAFAKNASKQCTYCAKDYELPSFGRTGKFCSQSCAKRSAASSRWGLYHANKRSEAPMMNKTPVKRRSSNVNGRGWIRSSGNRNETNATGTHQRQNQTPAGVSIAHSIVSNLNPTSHKSGQQQSAVSHGPRLSSDNGPTSGEHNDASFSFQQQRTPPAQLPISSPPRRDVTHQSPVPTGDGQVRDSSDPTHKHPSEWGVQEVYSFVKSLPGCSGYAEEFRLQEIDGQALLLLKEDHLMTTLNLKLGPALKICQQIMALKDSFS